MFSLLLWLCCHRVVTVSSALSCVAEMCPLSSFTTGDLDMISAVKTMAATEKTV